MHKEKLPSFLRDVLENFAKLHNAAREATNTANREKTKARNTVKDYWIANKLPVGSFVRVAGYEFRYEAPVSERVDADAILEMYDNGEIERDQFVRMLKIDTKQAQNVLGGDVVADNTIEDVGDKLDLRIKALPVEEDDDEFIVVNRTVKRKFKRRKFGGAKETARSKDAPRRIIKTRARK